MHHRLTVVFMVRGDTGVDHDVISKRLGELGDGESVAWQRYDMLGGGDITVTRQGDRFAVAGQTRL